MTAGGNISYELLAIIVALVAMSALGHKRTFAMQERCPLYPRIADMCSALAHVRFVPCVDGSELARAFFTLAALVGAAMCSAC